MSRYDVDKFVPLPDQELICCICTNVLDEPVESPCRHVFCKICIETWLNNKSNCPTCRNRVTKTELKPVLPLVRNMLNKLTIMCDFIDNGCKDLISLEKYPNHIKTCDYERVVCRYPNCAKSMLRKIIRHHEEEECPCREILCSKECGLRIPFEEINTHGCLSALKAFGEARNKQTELLKAELTELRTKFERLKQEVKTLKKEASRRRHSSWDSSSTSSQNSDYSVVRLRSRSPHSRSRSPSRSPSHSLSRSPLRSMHTSDSSIDSFPLPHRERDEQEAILNSIGIATNEQADGPPATSTQPLNANTERRSPTRNNAPTHGYRCIMCDEIYEYCTCVRELARDTEEDIHSNRSYDSVNFFGEGQFSTESDLSNSEVLTNNARTLNDSAQSLSNRERSYTSTSSSYPSRIGGGSSPDGYSPTASSQRHREVRSSHDGYSPTTCSLQDREDDSSQDGYSPTARSHQHREIDSNCDDYSPTTCSHQEREDGSSQDGYSPTARFHQPRSNEDISSSTPNQKAPSNSPTNHIGLPSREHGSSTPSDYSPTCISKDQTSYTKYWSHWGYSPVALVYRTPSPHTSHSSRSHSTVSTTFKPTVVSKSELHNVLSTSDCSVVTCRRTSKKLASSSEKNSESEDEDATPHSEHITDLSCNREDDPGTSISDNQDHNSSHSQDTSGSDAETYEDCNAVSSTESSKDNSCRSSILTTKKKVRCRKRKRSKQVSTTVSWSTTESESSCTEYKTKNNRKRCKLTLKNVSEKYKTDHMSLAPITQEQGGEEIHSPGTSDLYVTRSSANKSNDILNTTVHNNETLLELNEELLSLHEAPTPQTPPTPRERTGPSNLDDSASE